LEAAAGPRWVVVGAPLDSSGEGRGEANAPAALRAAGIGERIDALDSGDISNSISSPARDPRTGVIGFDHVRAASIELRQRIAAVIAEGRRPLVIGGDCTLLVGVFAGLRDRWDRLGLWFVDGHLDFYDGVTSPTGETADMELAVLTGHGPPGLIDIAETEPLVAPDDVVVLGHRAIADSDSPEELEMVHPSIEIVDAPTVAGRGPGPTGQEAEARLAERTDAVWLHLDLDVLSTESLAAVSYRQPGGLSWDELAMLLRPLVESHKLAGVSVADLNADLDRDGAGAKRVSELVSGLLKEG
jgi:arginase